MLLLEALSVGIVTGWVLWITLIVLVLICTLSEYNEWEPGSALGVAFLGVALWFVTEPFGAIYSSLAKSPGQLAGFAGLYFVFGALYSIVRWWRYCVGKIEDLEDSFEGREKDRDYAQQLESLVDYKLKVINNKSLLFLWIGYWPVSILWWLLNDPITKIVKWIFRQLRSIYESISDAITADSRTELASVKARLDAERDERNNRR